MATAPSDMPATPNMWCAYETRNQRVPPPRRPACASELSRHSPPTPQGEFAANQYEGHGTYTFPDGSSYEGAFQAGQMHGAGCYLDKQARPAAQRVPSVEPPLRPSRTTSWHTPSPPPLAALSEPPCHVAQGVSWKGKFYNGMGPGLPTNATLSGPSSSRPGRKNSTYRSLSGV